MKLTKLMTLICFCFPHLAWGADSVIQNLNTNIPKAIHIENSSTATDTIINPDSGNLEHELGTFFEIQTNVCDTSVVYIMESTVKISDGTSPPGYILDNGQHCVILGNSDILPTQPTYNKIISGIKGKTPNIIVYPLTNTTSAKITSNPLIGNTVTLALDPKGQQDFSIRQNLEHTPKPIGGYDLGDDEAGAYEATIKLTAISL